jgi:hypothetical protein
MQDADVIFWAKEKDVSVHVIKPKNAHLNHDVSGTMVQSSNKKALHDLPTPDKTLAQIRLYAVHNLSQVGKASSLSLLPSSLNTALTMPASLQVALHNDSTTDQLWARITGIALEHDGKHCILKPY